MAPSHERLELAGSAEGVHLQRMEVPQYKDDRTAQDAFAGGQGALLHRHHHSGVGGLFLEPHAGRPAAFEPRETHQLGGRPEEGQDADVCQSGVPGSVALLRLVLGVALPGHFNDQVSVRGASLVHALWAVVGWGWTKRFPFQLMFYSIRIG